MPAYKDAIEEITAALRLAPKQNKVTSQHCTVTAIQLHPVSHTFPSGTWGLRSA